MSTSPKSNGFEPLSIHSANAIPAPPADCIPIELKPAATQKLSSSGARPKWYASSGVKLSGPLKNVCMPASARIGIRSHAASKIGSK